MPHNAVFSAQTSLAEIGAAGQAQLGAARALVIGLGGLGCPAALYLAAAGIGHLTLCDDDRVEESNLARQTLYGATDIGAPKAETAAAKLRALYPWVQVSARPERVTQRNAAALIAAHDIVLECSDNLATKFLVHDAAYAAQVPLAVASLYQWEGQLALYDFAALRLHGCMRCAWPRAPEEGCVGGCAETGVLASVAGMLGAMQANMALLFVLGLHEDLAGAHHLFDARSLEMRRVALAKRADCPLCGEANAVEAPIEIAALDQLPGPYRLIDIRPAAEADAAALPPGLTHERVLPHALAALPPTALVLFCATGKRSFAAARQLRALGRAEVYSLAGGLKTLRKL